ncbi:Ohr family peroxiredoxin [Pseudomonas abietaniphila]|jgi:Ohr subfamily peroxiredoxin|uniref:Peroxiredoxin, Ohr subfamily n=1 Tax=Pseudomonas abietaniphila TaxID=89065 RepID=A0A1G7RMW5_9PSED|nr:Ohr family peroxiredoxin [Pseudomonas abietaniphila]SDG12062.1 peroxiredoxin, Ohr subfamily [Pseudomonas abietaniphila]
MINIEKILYSSRTRTTGGREGSGNSLDGRLDVLLSPPGTPGHGTNPEQLLGVGWSASLISSLRHACNARKVTFPADTAVEAQIDLGHGERGFFLRAHLSIALPGVDEALVHELVEAATHTCPFSKAMRENIDVNIVGAIE